MTTDGYEYKCYLNNVAVRTGYITWYYNNVDFADEAWSEADSFTSDTYNDHFINPYLYLGSTWKDWGSSIGTQDLYATSPQRYDSYPYLGKYVFDAWVT